MALFVKGMNFIKQDLEVLSYLHTVKVATYDQINRDIYPGYHSRSVCNRIYKLEENGLVCGISNRMLCNGRRLLSLTNKGFENFVAKGTEERIELKSDAVHHDLELVDIRQRLLKAKKVVGYYSENEIQSWGVREYDGHLTRFVNLNSDGLVDVAFSKGNLLVPLEFEKNGKSSSIYEPLLKKYYNRGDVAVVLYICETQNILDKLMKIEWAICKNDAPKFLYALKQTFDSDEALKFTNSLGKSLKLNPSDAYEPLTNE